MPSSSAFAVTFAVKVQPGQEAAYRSLCERTAASQAGSADLQGMLFQRFCEDAGRAEDGGRLFTLAEVFADSAAFQSHLGSAPLARWMERFNGLGGEVVRAEVFAAEADLSEEVKKTMETLGFKFYLQKAGFARKLPKVSDPAASKAFMMRFAVKIPADKQSEYATLCEKVADMQEKNAANLGGMVFQRFSACAGEAEETVLMQCFSDCAAFKAHLESDELKTWFGGFGEMKGEVLTCKIYGDVGEATTEAGKGFAAEFWRQKAGFARY